MLFVVALYASLYILLNLSSVQHAVRDIAQTELTKLLGAKVTIGNIAIHPFNEVVATDVSLTGDTNSDTILTVSKLGSSISLYQLIKNQRIVLTYAELIGLDCHISRPTPDGVLNKPCGFSAMGSSVGLVALFLERRKTKRKSHRSST